MVAASIAPRRPAAALAGACLATGCLVAGCSLITDSFRSNDFSGDPFPIGVDLQSGAVMVGLRQEGRPDRLAVLDVLSPLTLIDPGPSARPSLGTADLTLLGRSDQTGALEVPRARFLGADLLSLHPCSEDTCAVGPEATPRPYDAILGANALAGDALRLRLGDAQAFVLADVGGDARDRTYVCDAVFPSPYRGGGTLIISGTEVSFGGRRVTLQACLGDDPSRAVQGARGADALLVLSTGVGASLLSEAAYERYRQARTLAGASPPPPPLDALPITTVLLPSGPVSGRRGALDRLALAAAASSGSRAPCRQVYAHHLQTRNIGCTVPETDDPPCPGGALSCAVPAIVELAPAAGVEILIVSDGDPTLQALRTELRPDQPEVDGVLGAGALLGAEIDVDYPHNRVLMRCAAAGCTARPALAELADCDQILGCLGGPRP